MTNATPRIPANAASNLLVRGVPDRERRPHLHAEGQFVLVKRGYLNGGTDTQQWLLQAGTAVWIPPWHTHWGQGEGDVELAVLYLAQAQCARLPEKVTPLHAGALLRALTERLLAPAAPLHQARMLDLLIDEIAAAEPDGLVLTLPRDRRLQSVVSTLLHTPSERTTLAEWAGRTGATERTLSRLFIRETGLSYRDWCHRLRLREAMRGLAKGMTNAVLAERLGFSSPDGFGHWFRRQTGLTPQQFKTRAGTSA